MRWLYHLLAPDAARSLGHRFGAESVAREGFVHCSYRDAVEDTARIHLAGVRDIAVIQIDPRRLDARVEDAATPRGPMPHVHGAIPRDAVRDVFPLADIARAPDVVRGTRFGFVAFEGMTLLDLVGMVDPIGRIASMGIDAESTCEIVGATAARVFAAHGVTVTASRVRPPLDGFDVVLVPGGLGARALVHDRAVVEWLETFPENRIVASVCTGALLLGAAGRLRGKRATTHHTALELLAEYGATAVRERVVDEGTVVTAGGVTSALDLGLHLVGRLEGGDAARTVATQMEWTPR